MKNYLIALCCAVIISGCAKTEVLSEAPYADRVKFSEYKIGNNDQLLVSVWKNTELSISVPVRPDGKISMPLVGDAQAQGLTPEALATELADKLSKYIRAPNVTVVVQAANSASYSSRVRITGAVNAPLSIPYYTDLNVLDLVLEAGGLTEFANADESILYRKTPEGIKPYHVNVEDILYRGILETNYTLRPSDILIIPESVF
ncbi:XrtA/PEP-CTERM system exopolysaccharide export protein [Psychromonas sp. 14N.309.X.WAT.B.A12]|uniref:XrtA/PEP-CTERM system exopolysaccharide export protein n=1 Tax=unclassified Psychromonas TaxID=2614957 RepID=UPI0025AEECB5|nr:XrtA/PEP-CTERM system exopolysaccharide export protein [Psychromonas sp. 14N.309.X.WAT.B.A12]MDN2662781.1 polysaccharide biosynthesis/export family protein [Psychromonas sp. 14N.309.X.WAT.B.A12]